MFLDSVNTSTTRFHESLCQMGLSKNPIWSNHTFPQNPPASFITNKVKSKLFYHEIQPPEDLICAWSCARQSVCGRRMNIRAYYWKNVQITKTRWRCTLPLESCKYVSIIAVIMNLREAWSRLPAHTNGCVTLSKSFNLSELQFSGANNFLFTGLSKGLS